MATITKELNFQSAKNQVKREFEWIRPRSGGPLANLDCDVRVSLISPTGSKVPKKRVTVTFYHEMWTIFEDARVSVAYSFGRFYLKSDTNGYKISGDGANSKNIQITSNEISEIFERKIEKGDRLEYDLKFDKEYELYYIDLN